MSEQRPNPYQQSVSLAVGFMVKIMGNLESSCGKNPELVVDFCTGIEEDSDIAFHFRVYTNSMVVMNSFQKGGWQEEKRMFSDPFMPGQPFELRFLVLENEYKVPYTRVGSLTVGSSLTIKGKTGVSFRWVRYIQPMGVEVEEE
ncbi:galectin-16 isoform X3 [Bos taurus]|uniref:galectin-16 isoform X3 n=1 Tax=Bos taurus TaxID=9913 RepID=UPI000D535DC3|nr:galectin-16 isoform X3 [Bos taurus]